MLVIIVGAYNINEFSTTGFLLVPTVFIGRHGHTHPHLKFVYGHRSNKILGRTRLLRLPYFPGPLWVGFRYLGPTPKGTGVVRGEPRTSDKTGERWTRSPGEIPDPGSHRIKETPDSCEGRPCPRRVPWEGLLREETGNINKDKLEGSTKEGGGKNSTS